jgi:hypothetical protein
MAKMIKCPTCQTQIEVPAQPTGQVVKCPGCGKGLKLVAKKKDPAGGGAGMQLTASGSPINPNSSLSGGSVSAMSFHGEPAPPDDLPNLDTNCQVCGRPTPFDELVEDNGKLVCGDCIKGARSSIARPVGGAEMVGFKAPEYRPSRRAKLINITPAFLAAIALGLIWLGCQMYLSFNPKPIGKGVAMANAVKPKPGLISTPKATTEPVTTAPMTSIETQATTSQPVAVENPPAPAPGATETTQPAAPTSQAVALAPQDNTIFNDNGKPAVPGAPVIPAPPAPELANADPIDRGIDRLQQGDYKAAKDAFEDGRKKYVLGGRMTANAPLTPQQAQVYNGLAASYIGLQKPEEAKVQFKILTDHGDKSRALVLNRAIAMLMENQIGPSEFNVAVPELKAYLDSASADDERAVDVFGSVLARLSAMPRVKRTDMEALWTAWDGYVDRLAAAHPGELKWGVQWMPAEQVQAFRKSRSVVTGLNPEQAGKNLQAAQARKKAAQTALDTAKALQAGGRPADPVGAQKRLDEAVKAEADAQRDFASVAAQATPPKWLDPKTQLQPVLP